MTQWLRSWCQTCLRSQSANPVVVSFHLSGIFWEAVGTEILNDLLWKILEIYYSSQKKSRILAQAAVTKFHRLGLLIDSRRFFFSHNPGGWKFKIRGPAWLGSAEHPLPGCRLATFHFIRTAWGAEEGSKLSDHSSKGVTPFMRFHDLMWSQWSPQSPTDTYHRIGEQDFNI